MYEYKAKVIRVVDGDTVDALVDLGFHISVEMKLRLYGINAPELKEAAGKVSRDRLIEKVEGKEVTILTMKDKQEKYGRYLATIISENENINEWLLSENLAIKFMV